MRGHGMAGNLRTARRHAVLAALIITCSGVQEVAAANVYICRDLGTRNPNPMRVTVDPANMTLTMDEISAYSHTHCKFVFRNGAYGPTTIGPNAQYCSLAQGGGNIHQRVVITSDTATAKFINDQGEANTITIDLAHGTLRTSLGDNAKCDQVGARSFPENLHPGSVARMPPVKPPWSPP
jgi:hypothetical protein